MNDIVPSLEDRILAELRRAPGSRAVELASALGVDRREVNRCLAYNLVGRVRQHSDYRWQLVGSGRSTPRTRAGQPRTEIARLCRYYLECIGQDMDQGVSVLASSPPGEIHYAELSALPLAASETEWFNEPGAGRILGKVRQDRTKLVAWLGYPVRLRRHRTPRWEGFLVEPVLLWRIELGEQGGDSPRIADEAPLPNARFLRTVAMGDGQNLAEETARLTEELGLNVPSIDLPETDEMIERLARIRPEWDWKEAMDPGRCGDSVQLADLTDDGIYNRAIVVPGERTVFTQGLESELEALGAVSESGLHDTALGQWLRGTSRGTPGGEDREPLLEVLPMNTEQRAAVRAALSSSHTVVTGPPGTGKSQVVTNLLVNAAWRGMNVLFASKNNKAVDVVETRVNGLGNRPVLLRLGANEYQAKLAEYLTQLLAGAAGADDRERYEEELAYHRSLAAQLAELDQSQQRSLDARNAADRLDASAEDARSVFGAAANVIDEALVSHFDRDVAELERAIDAADPARERGLKRLAWGLFARRRLRAVARAANRIQGSALSRGVDFPGTVSAPTLAVHRNLVEICKGRVHTARKLLSYQNALEILKRCVPFEEIARQRAALTEQVAQNSQSLWRAWVQLAPTRLTPEQRKDVADYAAVLQLLTAPDARKLHGSVRQKANALQVKVSALFPCWAVTSLSARGRVPFEPGHFDLVIIDEASQCDIASALPLLYRARRSVIIGDPQQLRHISALSRPRDSELQHKHDLVETRVGWMYSVSSLYDVAASVVTQESFIKLRDHHRSHADIIGFSNQAFYEGRLRVATRHQDLKRPRSADPGIVWQDVRGNVTRPAAGGAQNAQEARALVAALEDLLITRGYPGTVGVVTPFRAQAQLLQQLVEASQMPGPIRDRSDLLVDTVHRFQGDERDVMFFSPVVSEGTPAGALAFLRSNGNLFNVAITRARGLLHIVGDRAAAESSGVDYLARFAIYVAHLNSVPRLPLESALSALGPEYPAVARPEQVSDWERILYRALYAAGIRPIPQYSIEQYNLDFAVIVGARKLDIEVDGERYHRSWTGELCLRDQLRNQRLIELGWDVKRFWVYEIRDHLDECVAGISTWVEEAAEKEKGDVAHLS
ncbi:MAG: AAA domain-containing protein [Gammaproteobacteria bacterium]